MFTYRLGTVLCIFKIMIIDLLQLPNSKLM